MAALLLKQCRHRHPERAAGHPFEWFVDLAMPHYEVEDYVQEHVTDESVNANCVASWSARADAEGQVERPRWLI